MTDRDDPLLAADTVAAFVRQVNAVYGLRLPAEPPPPQTLLGEVWTEAVTVKRHPRPGVLYRAKVTRPIPVPAGWPSMDLSIDVCDDDGGAPV